MPRKNSVDGCTSGREAHVRRKIIELKAVIGGEGNGGVIYPALHVGRDAPVAGRWSWACSLASR